MDLKKALQELAQMIKNEVLRRMESNIGVNPRTGENTLVGSDLYKSVDVYPVGENRLVFQIASHYEYVVKGWKFNRGDGTFNQYLININEWIRRKGISWTYKTGKKKGHTMTQSDMVWALANRMFNKSLEKPPYTIKARPFINYDEHHDIEKILPFLNEFFERWADEIFEEVCNELDKYFSE